MKYEEQRTKGVELKKLKKLSISSYSRPEAKAGKEVERK